MSLETAAQNIQEIKTAAFIFFSFSIAIEKPTLSASESIFDRVSIHIHPGKQLREGGGSESPTGQSCPTMGGSNSPQKTRKGFSQMLPCHRKLISPI